MTAATPRISVVIPARNDAAALERTLDHLVTRVLPAGPPAEIIVAAWGDPEGTERAVGHRARLVWPAGSTRAALMNAGAAVAAGDVLFFLHADSLPPASALAAIDGVLGDARIVGGAFDPRFAEDTFMLWVVCLIHRARCRLTRNYYGDQGLFVRAQLFRALGGFANLAIMEDLDFSQRLKRAGRTALVRLPLVTSGRRFLTRGPWRTLAFCAWMIARHMLGLDTQRYAEAWRGPADKPPGSRW